MSYYTVDGEIYDEYGERFDDASSVAQVVCNEDNVVSEEDFDSYLDEEGDIEIFGMHYLVSYVLKKVDPIAYRCMFNDWSDDRLSDARKDAEDLIDQLWYDGDEIDINGYAVTYHDNNDDEEDGEDEL